MTDGMHVCKHNQNIMCQERNCGHCGWNPVISEKRLDAFREKHGIKKKKTNERLINAVDIEARIRTCVEPLAEKGYSTWRILADRCLKVKGLECSLLGEVIDMLKAAPVAGKRWVSTKEQMPGLTVDWWEDAEEGRCEFEVSDFVLGMDKDGKVQVVRYETGPCYTGWADDAGTEYDICQWMPLPEKHE